MGNRSSVSVFYRKFVKCSTDLKESAAIREEPRACWEISVRLALLINYRWSHSLSTCCGSRSSGAGLRLSADTVWSSAAQSDPDLVVDHTAHLSQVKHVCVSVV